MGLISFRGFTFASNNFQAWRVIDSRDLTVTANYVAGGYSVPQFAGVTLAPRILHYQVSSTSGDLETQRQTLELGMRMDLNDLGTLIETRADSTQVEHQARLLTMTSPDNVTFDLLFEVADPYWNSSTANSATATGPASAGGTLTRTLTTSGTVRALPKVTLTPQTQKTSGVTVHTLSTTVTENSGNALTNVAWTITFDHATQVTAGNSTSAGTDIRVYVNGTEVKRGLSGTNTSTCRVCFPLTIAASGTATVNITYAGSGQTYGLGAYAQDGTQFLVTENSGNALADYPYLLVFNHASYVTASRSKSSGADIRVLVNGTEVDRAVQNANTTTTRIWFPLAVAASATAVIDIEMSSSGYDFAGTTYTNGALDLGTSNTTFTYTTPGFTNGSDTPGILKPILAQIGTSGNPTNYTLKTATFGSDPGIEIDIMDVGSPTDNGDYLRFYWGGVLISKIRFRVYGYHNDFSAGPTYRSLCRVGASSDLSTWSSVNDFAQSTIVGTAAIADYTAPAGSIAMMVGIERCNSVQSTGTGVTNYIQFCGNGSDEMSVTLDSASVPSNAAMTAPSNSTGSSTIAYVFAGTLTDELGHGITVANLTAPVTGTQSTANLLLSSAAFTASAWSATGATITDDAVTGINGQTDATTLVEDTSTGDHKVVQAITKAASALQYVASVYAKSSARNLTIWCPDSSGSNGVYARFNPSTGAIVTAATTNGTGFTAGTATITAAANGYYRCSVSFTSSTDTSLDIQLQATSGTSSSYTGDGSSTIDLWGAQLEQSASLGTYVATGTGACGSLVIDAATKTAWLLDRGGTEVANSATAARSALSLSGSDEDWLALDPGATSTLTWTESDMDANGMTMTVAAADRWH